MMKCALCNAEIEPGQKYAREVKGWEQDHRLGASGGSNVIARSPTGRLAHWGCVTALRHGVTPGQATLACAAEGDET